MFIYIKAFLNIENNEDIGYNYNILYGLFMGQHHRQMRLSSLAAHAPCGGARNSFPLAQAHSW